MRMCSSRAKVQAGRFGVLNAALLFTCIWSATAQRSGYRGCLERALTCGPAQGASFAGLFSTHSLMHGTCAASESSRHGCSASSVQRTHAMHTTSHTQGFRCARLQAWPQRRTQSTRVAEPSVGHRFIDAFRCWRGQSRARRTERDGDAGSARAPRPASTRAPARAASAGRARPGVARPEAPAPSPRTLFSL